MTQDRKAELNSDTPSSDPPKLDNSVRPKGDHELQNARLTPTTSSVRIRLLLEFAISGLLFVRPTIFIYVCWEQLIFWSSPVCNSREWKLCRTRNCAGRRLLLTTTGKE